MTIMCAPITRCLASRPVRPSHFPIPSPAPTSVQMRPHPHWLWRTHALIENDAKTSVTWNHTTGEAQLWDATSGTPVLASFPHQAESAPPPFPQTANASSPPVKTGPPASGMPPLASPWARSCSTKLRSITPASARMGGCFSQAAAFPAGRRPLCRQRQTLGCRHGAIPGSTLCHRKNRPPSPVQSSRKQLPHHKLPGGQGG